MKFPSNQIYENSYEIDDQMIVNNSVISSRNKGLGYVFEDEEDITIQETDDNEKSIVDEFVNSIIMEEIDSLFEEYCSELDRDEVKALKEEYLRLINESEEENFNLEESSTLFEGQAGYDCTEWIRGLAPKVGWLGKWVLAGLGALGTALGALVVMAKDMNAMRRLKNYMNRLVEVVDQGIHKKRPWYTVFLPKKSNAYKNTGEYNIGCFRSIQEMADRNMCVSVMLGAEKLGFFGRGQMMNMVSGGSPQNGGGIMAFKTNVVDKLTFLK